MQLFYLLILFFNFKFLYVFLFIRERIPERVVHAKGAGAFGYFEVTHDITKYCKAKVFSEIGKRTPVAVRFSTVGKYKHCNKVLVKLKFYERLIKVFKRFL